MKKYFLFLLLSICLTIVDVNAETKLVVDCEPKVGKRVNEADAWQNADSKFFIFDGKVVNVDSYIKPVGKYHMSSDVYNNFVTFGSDKNAVVKSDIGSEFVVENNYLYVYSGSTSLEVYKYDSSYTLKGDYTFTDIVYKDYSSSFLSMYNNELYIYLEKNGGADQKIFKLNLDNQTSSEITYSEDNFKKYFEDYYRKSTVVDNGEALSEDDVYLDGDNTLYIKGNTIKYVSKDGVIFQENVIDTYVKLKNPKVIGDYIVVTAAKDSYKYKTKYFSRTDLLVFDKKGNLLKTLAENNDYLDYIMHDNKLYLTTYYIDGVCSYVGNDYYEYFNQGCEGSWSNQVCSIREEEVEGKTDEEVTEDKKEEEKVENSETNDGIIIIFVILILSTIYFVRKSKELI